MKELELYQKTLADSLAKAINGHNETINAIERIAKMKTMAIKGKILDKIFDCDDLLSDNRWNKAEHLRKKGHKYKAVAVIYNVEGSQVINFIAGKSNTYTDPFSISIMFMRDPMEVLNKKNLTTTETKVLKSLYTEYKKNHQYEYYDNEKSYNNINDLSWRLHDMKNELDITIKIHWSFKFETLTADDFLERGLKARVPLL